MKCNGRYIGVVFDESHLKSYDLGNGIKLERAESWRAREDDGETNTKLVTNVNHLEVNPQIGWVAITNSEYNFEIGDKIFMHYLAYEMFEDRIVDSEDREVYFVDATYVFFKIKDELEMMPNTYLGIPHIEPPPQTASGIFLTSQREVKDELRVTITHEPQSAPNRFGIVIPRNADVGDVVLPMDRSNYYIKLDDKEYVVLKEHEIIGKLWEDQEKVQYQ